MEDDIIIILIIVEMIVAIILRLFRELIAWATAIMLIHHHKSPQLLNFG